MLYKYLASGRLDVIKNLQIRFTPYRELNDPFEGFFLFPPPEHERKRAFEDNYSAESAEMLVFLETHLSQLGMLCLSRTPDNLLMWAHYAENYTGFAIGFDETHEWFNRMAWWKDRTYDAKVELFAGLQTVTYAESWLQIERDSFYPSEVFSRKSVHWSYEQEVRVFRNLEESSAVRNDKVHLFNIPPETVREVYLGPRMTKENRVCLTNCIIGSSDLNHVRIVDCQLSRAKFAIDFSKWMP